MCEPATLSTIGVVTGLVGSGVTAYSAYTSGKAQAAAASAQAEQANANAEAALEEGRVAEAQQRRKVAQTLGTQRAALAANGAELGDMDSSAQNILGDTAQWGDYDARLTRYNSEMKAWSYKNQANAYSASASQYTTAGAIGAGASLLSGASSVANSWYNYNKAN